MNRRQIILSLGVLPLTIPAHVGRAASGASVEWMVAAPPIHRHELTASGYCPICGGWVSGPTDGASLVPGTPGESGPNTLEPLV